MRLSTGMLAGGTCALLLAGCGPKQLALPADPIDRAATCGVVAAVEARAATPQISAPLPFEAQGRILHYALLAGADDQGFAQDRAVAVANRMPEVEAGITGGKWQPLQAECGAAFPATRAAEVKLPADRLEARLGCYALGSFIVSALKMQDAAYGDQMAEYGSLNRRLDAKIANGLAARGIRTGTDRADALRGEALSTLARLGPPPEVMAACIAADPPEET